MFKNPTCQPAIAIVTPSIFLSSLRHPSLQICANFTQGNFFRDKISYKFLPLIVRLSEVCTHHYAFFKNLVHIYMKTSFQKHHQKTPPHCFLFGQSDNGPLQITLFSSLVVGITTIVSVVSIFFVDLCQLRLTVSPPRQPVFANKTRRCSLRSVTPPN